MKNWKITFLCVFIVLLNVSIVEAQPTFSGSTSYAQPTDSDLITGSFILPDSDGNYFLISNYRDNNPSPSNWNARIMKTDSEGNVLNLSGPANPLNLGSTGDDILRSAVEVSDGYIMTGSHSGVPVSGNKRLWVRKSNKNLQTQWSFIDDNGQDEFGFTIEHAENGNFIVGGCKDGNPHCWIVQDFGTSGAVIDDFPIFGMDFLVKIEKNADGDYYFFGANTALNGNFENVVVQKRNSNFDILFTKVLGGDTVDALVDGISTNDGGFVILANTLSESFNGDTGENNILGGQYFNGINGLSSGFDHWIFKGSSITGSQDWLIPVGFNLVSFIESVASDPYGLVLNCDENVILGNRCSGFCLPEVLTKYSIQNGSTLWNENYTGLGGLSYSDLKLAPSNEIVAFGQGASNGQTTDVTILSRWSADSDCQTTSCNSFEDCLFFLESGSAIVCDEMEQYNEGPIAPQSSIWSNFDIGTDAFVTNDFSFKGNQSLRFDRVSNTDFSDVVLELGNQNEGVFRLDWKMFIENNAQPRWGILYDFTGNPNTNDWAYRVHFEGNGQGNIYPGVNSNNSIGSFSYEENQWLTIVQIFNLGTQQVEFWINDTFITSFDFNIGNPTGSLQIGDMNIWHGGGSNSFFIDALCFREADCTWPACDIVIDFPVCVNGVEFGWPCLASCQGYTENEWVEGNCESCTFCEDQATGEVFFCDDFESYQANQKLNPQSNDWNGVNSGSPFVDNTQAMWVRWEAITGQSSFHSFGNLTNGRYRLAWEQQIEDENSNGYYAITHGNVGVINNNFAYEVFFENDGTGTVEVGGSSLVFNFNYPIGTYFNVVQIIDIEQDIAELFINNEFVGTWTFSLGSAFNLNQLGAVLFQNYPDFSAVDTDFKVDNFCFKGPSNLICICSSEYDPVCVAGRTYPNPCEASCDGYTEYEWTEGKCIGCDDCLDCFSYLLNKDDPKTCYFYNNNCDPIIPEGPEFTTSTFTYEWTVYQNNQQITPIFQPGTDQNSENPIIEFPNSGDYEVCQIIYNDGVPYYECCLIVPIPTNPCYEPPVCDLEYSYNSISETFTLNAGATIGADYYKWDIPSSYLTNGSTNSSQISFTLPFSSVCIEVCVLVTNDCGISTYCVEVCKDIFCDNNGQNIPSLMPGIIQPQINNNQVTFTNVPSGFALNWEAINADFINGTDNESQNPVLEYDTCGNYLVCLYLNDGDFACANDICLCWTIPIPPPDNCDDDLCEDEPDMNCDGIEYYFEEFFNAGNLFYSFEFTGSLSPEDEFCHWEVYRENNINPISNTPNDIGYFPGLTYTVCYVYWDADEECLKECCKTFIAEPPYNCGNDIINCDLLPNEDGFQFSLNAPNVLFSSITWLNDDTDTEIPNGTVFFNGNCQYFNVSVRYYDLTTGCWRICCKTIWLCPPSNCEADILCEVDPETGDYTFTLIAGSVDENSISWQNDNNPNCNLPEDTPSFSYADYCPLPCTTQTISVRYRDPLTNCWYICCKTVYLCQPENCEDVINYYYNGNTIELELIAGNIDESSIEWFNDTDNEPIIPQSNPRKAIPYSTLPPDCEEKWITVKYYDNDSECWYICCRRILFCDPLDCEDIIDYYFDGTQYVLTFNGNAGNPAQLEWLDDNTGSVIPNSGNSTSINYQLPPPNECEAIPISVRYFDPSTNCWRICCRIIYICNPTQCSNVIDFIDNMNGTGQLNLVNANFDNPEPEWYCEGELIGSGASTFISNLTPGESKEICVYYFDLSSGCWYVCCRDIVPNCDAPQVNFNWSAIGLGGSFTNISQISGNNPTFLWNFGDGSSNSNEENPFHIYSMAGTYECCLTVTDECGTDMYCEFVDVEPIPTLIFDLEDEVCALPGETVQIPVRVSNFDCISAFSFSLEVEGTGTLIDVVGEHPNFTNPVLNAVTGNNMAIIYNGETPLNIADNSVAFEIEIQVFGDIGDCINIVSSNSPVSLVAGFFPNCDVNAIANTLSIEVIGGSVCLKSPLLNVEGKIHGWGDQIEEGINLTEINLSEGAIANFTTSPDGLYEFLDLEPNLNYTIFPEKDINHSNGVNAFDVFLTQQHILGVLPFTSPFQHIAADVNVMDKVNIVDVSIIRQMALGNISNYEPFNTSWRFVASDYVFINPNDPLEEDFPASISYNPLEMDEINQDFTGVKIGDVDNSANPLQIINDDAEAKPELNSGQSNNTLNLLASVENGHPGDTIAVKITSVGFDSLVSLGYTMNWDTSILSFIEVDSFHPNFNPPQTAFPTLTNGNFGNNTDSGILTFVWDDVNFDGVSLPQNEPLFLIYFKIIGVIEECSTIDFSDTPADTIVVNANLEFLTFNGNAGSVKVIDFEDISFDINVQNVDCFENSTGAIELFLSGGSGNFQIEWNTGAISTNLTNLPTGIFSATITDTQTGAIIETGNIEITQPNEIEVEITNQDVLCFGESTGSAAVNATGGVGGYSFDWSNGVSGILNSNLMSGNYYITVTDENGCTDSSAVFVNQPFEIEINTEVENETNDLTNGKISLQVEGGVQPYSFIWNHDISASSEQVCDLDAGIYFVTVVDANDCEMALDIEVDNVVSTQWETQKEHFKIYPNPTENVLFLQIEDIFEMNKNVSIQIFDASGKLVFQEHFRQLVSPQNLEFDLPTGLYLIQLSDGKRTLFDKIVIGK